jgi:hypothetical protein
VAYQLKALIGPAAAVSLAAERLTLEPVSLPQGFALLPIELDDEDLIVDPDLFLSAVFLDAAAAASVGGAIAYVEADFFGGVGTQTSMTWIDGAPTSRVIFDTPEAFTEKPRPQWPINTALRQLGVALLGTDEFETLELGRHRDTEDWRPD